MKSEAKTTPVDDDGILAELIRFLIRNERSQLLVGFFEEVWGRRAAGLGGYVDSDAPLLERLQAVEAALQMQGFEASIGRDEQGVFFLRQGRCPFVHAVTATHLPCKLEEQMLSELAGVRCARLCNIADGDGACVYRFEPEISLAPPK